MKILRTILISAIMLAAGSLRASAYGNVAFHCDSDTTIINALLSEQQLADMSQASRVAFFAKNFADCNSNLRSEILEGMNAEFTVNAHEFNPLSLISTCVALAQAYETSSAPNWRDFAERYEDVMYKGGKANGYISRFLYPSDWIADNIFRGNVTDATQYLDGIAARRKEKSLDYISRHRDNFKALSDSATYEKLKMLEMGFRNHQIPYITSGDLTNPKRFKEQAHDGDIFFLIAPDVNLDSREMGILVFEGDILRIIQVSQNPEKVVVESLPFEAYVKRNIKRIKGMRLIRVK